MTPEHEANRGPHQRAPGDAPTDAPDRSGVARRRQVIMDFVLVFVAASVLALALLPVATARRIDRINLGVRETLQRARDLNHRVSRHQSQAMALTQAFVESADPLVRQRYLDHYRAHRDTINGLMGEMDELATELAPDVAPEVLTLFNRSLDWHMRFEPLLRGDIALADFARDVDTEVEDYQAWLTQAGEVEALLAARVEESQAEVDNAVSQQWTMATMLAFLGMFSIFAVSFVARRTHQLTREAERRRRDAVEARREADAVLAGTGDGVIGVDLEGRCTFVNRAAVEMLGRSAPSLLGRMLHAEVHHTREDGTSYPRDECPLMGALEMDRATPPIDEFFIRGDGSRFPVRVFSRPLVDGVDVRGAVLSFVDMTEIRDAERQLKEAIGVREEVVGIVSHDLRNPVGTVALAADLLLDVPLPPEKQREQLGVIKRQAKHMERLIRDLLDVTRIESGTLPVHPSLEPLDELVREALDGARALAEQKRILLTEELDPGLPLVRADRGRILQVFSNLVGNAIKFTPEGGRITLSARRDVDGVCVGVSDTGRGIAREDTDRVFGRFWQVGRKSDGTGVGLGLAIVKGIVEAHDGRVWVESSPGTGSTFYFTLPAPGAREQGLDFGPPIQA